MDTQTHNRTNNCLSSNQNSEYVSRLFAAHPKPSTEVNARYKNTVYVTEIGIILYDIENKRLK